MIQKNISLMLGTLLLCLSFLSSCSNIAPSHLIFHQDLVVGADISASSTASPLPEHMNVTFGYDRQTNAIIPKTRICSDPGENGEDVTRDCRVDEKVESTQLEAMSVISKSYIGMNWFGTDRVSERMATGDAATEMAKNPELIDALNDPEF